MQSRKDRFDRSKIAVRVVMRVIVLMLLRRFMYLFAADAHGKMCAGDAALFGSSLFIHDMRDTDSVQLGNDAVGIGHQL